MLLEKFMQFRKVIMKHLPAGETLPDVPDKKPTIAVAAVNLKEVVNYSIYFLCQRLILSHLHLKI